MIRYKKRKDVRCLYCRTEFRVYGIALASNSPYAKKHGRLLFCPTCKVLKKCKDIIPG